MVSKIRDPVDVDESGCVKGCENRMSEGIAV
jgi:hypothetical protein